MQKISTKNILKVTFKAHLVPQNVVFSEKRKKTHRRNTNTLFDPLGI